MIAEGDGEGRQVRTEDAEISEDEGKEKNGIVQASVISVSSVRNLS